MRLTWLKVKCLPVGEGGQVLTEDSSNKQKHQKHHDIHHRHEHELKRRHSHVSLTYISSHPGMEKMFLCLQTKKGEKPKLHL